MKTLKKIIGILILVLMMASCASESATSSGTLRIKAKATYVNPNGRAADDIVLTSVKVNIRKIELKINDDSSRSGDDDGNDDSNDDNSDDHNDDGYYNGDDEAELNGPWELDLLNQTAPITTVSVPNGVYEEVEFKLSPSLVSTSELFNKTILITGTINGTPFVLWHNFDADFSIDYHDSTQNLIIDNGTYDLVFNFDLYQALSFVDLSGAVDGDGDGIIEIGPDDTDGNNAIAAQLDTHMEDSCEMENENDD